MRVTEYFFRDQVPLLAPLLACVAGVNGEGKGEQERGKKWGTGGL